jgi:hypothetical protein
MHGRLGEIVVVLRGFDPRMNGDISRNSFNFLFVFQADRFS